ncbi:hypothetical protein ACH5RR_018536 [Cinchona calisaya]|uniref:Uncharacterized protein n=1 Tax=Cinchona calisaya TaxID=153742 RepID=A0ABD2ZPJ8_9GENT
MAMESENHKLLKNPYIGGKFGQKRRVKAESSLNQEDIQKILDIPKSSNPRAAQTRTHDDQQIGFSAQVCVDDNEAVEDHRLNDNSSQEEENLPFEGDGQARVGVDLGFKAMDTSLQEVNALTY